MAQPTQNSLIHVLFLWTTILSIVQGVFIVLFFTGGHHGQVRPLDFLFLRVEPTVSYRLQMILTNIHHDFGCLCMLTRV